MNKALTRTDFNFPGQKSVYHGKVRDVYNIDDEYLVMVVSDRISAFDVVLPKGIPYKGQVLNQIFIIDVVHISHFSVINTFLPRKIKIGSC